MDADLDTLATALYVTTDDFLIDNPQHRPWRPKVGITPRLEDAELVTLVVLQALLGFTSEARWLRYANGPLRGLFPYLPTQSGYNKRVRAATGMLRAVIAHLVAGTSRCTDDVWVVDSTPVECGRSRETTKRSDLAGWAEYGYCASHSCVDRVRFTRRPCRRACTRHQTGGHPHYRIPRHHQVLLEAPRDMPAVFDCPNQVSAKVLLCPADRLEVSTTVRCRHLLGQLAAGIIHGHQRVAELVCVHSDDRQCQFLSATTHFFVQQSETPGVDTGHNGPALGGSFMRSQTPGDADLTTVHTVNRALKPTEGLQQPRASSTMRTEANTPECGKFSFHESSNRGTPKRYLHNTNRAFPAGPISALQGG